MAKKKINNNCYKYVDLGLPSGTLWATCNVGASKPTQSGLYFQWGDTVGYKAEQVGKDKQFSCDDDKWGDYPNLTKYVNGGETLELEDDAAHANMGGSWHIPTPKQCQELIDNTTSNWVTQDDVNGRLFTSKNNGKSIFIPAAGVAWYGSILNSGNYGDIWASMLNILYAGYGQSFCFHSGYAYLYHDGDRYYGMTVRGVIG